MTRTTAQQAADAMRRRDYDTAARLYYIAAIESDIPSKEGHFMEMFLNAEYLGAKERLSSLDIKESDYWA